MASREAELEPPLVSPAVSFGPRIAIRDDAGDHDYSTLDTTSARLAEALLRQRDDLAGARVAVLATPSFAFVATLWGIWRAGGIAVPIAVNHPANEIAHVLDDAEPCELICPANEIHRLRDLCLIRSIRLSTLSDLITVSDRET
ncbi:MAG: AMP-binding protein, partial [Acidobacteriota bacterium]